MTKNPISVDKNMLAVKALAIMSDKKQVFAFIKVQDVEKLLVFFIFTIY